MKPVSEWPRDSSARARKTARWSNGRPERRAPPTPPMTTRERLRPNDQLPVLRHGLVPFVVERSHSLRRSRGSSVPALLADGTRPVPRRPARAGTRPRPGRPAAAAGTRVSIGRSGSQSAGPAPPCRSRATTPRRRGRLRARRAAAHRLWARVDRRDAQAHGAVPHRRPPPRGAHLDVAPHDPRPRVESRRRRSDRLPHRRARPERPLDRRARIFDASGHDVTPAAPAGRSATAAVRSHCRSTTATSHFPTSSTRPSPTTRPGRQAAAPRRASPSRCRQAHGSATS